jgi:predicted RNase H-like HicB family nuclease
MKKKSEPRQKFTAAISREGRWYVAQCLEIDIASQGRTEKTALKNLADALKLHFAPPVATAVPKIRSIAVRRAA